MGHSKSTLAVTGGLICLFVTNCYRKYRSEGVNYFRYVTPNIFCNSSTFSLPDECFQNNTQISKEFKTSSWLHLAVSLINLYYLCYTSSSFILHINRGWCWGGGVPCQNITKRRYQLECDKPLHREWGGGQNSNFISIRTF